MDKETILKWSDEEKQRVIVTLLTEAKERNKEKEEALILKGILGDVNEISAQQSAIHRSIKDYNFLVLTCLFVLIFIVLRHTTK